MLTLNDEIQLNNYTQIACLPQKCLEFPRPYTDAYAVGWGTTSSGASSTPNILRNVKLTVYDGPSCNKVNDVFNWNGQICAGEIAGGKDTCQGDSGGPLYVLDTINGKSKYILAGLTSYGIGCALPDYPGWVKFFSKFFKIYLALINLKFRIYTRISNYIDWINANTQSSASVTQSSKVVKKTKQLADTFPFCKYYKQNCQMFNTLKQNPCKKTCNEL